MSKVAIYRRLQRKVKVALKLNVRNITIIGIFMLALPLCVFCSSGFAANQAIGWQTTGFTWLWIEILLKAVSNNFLTLAIATAVMAGIGLTIVMAGSSDAEQQTPR